MATSFPSSFNLSSLDGSNGFVINGINQFDISGYSVSNAGDVNGDGIGDLIIGGYAPNNGAGQSYVVFGKSTGFSASLNLSSLDGSNGFVINGINQFDISGYSVSNAGDVNGDGIGDLIIGGYQANGAAGQSYVVFGKSTGFSASLNLSTLDGSNGFVINGINANDYSGYSVSNAGDVNGDGIADLIIGAPVANGYAGQTYVVFGKNTNPNINPIANPDSITTNEDNAVTFNVLANDSDPNNDPLTITQVNNSALTAGTPITLSSGALLTLNANNTFTYNPNGKFESLTTGQNGSDSFTYTIGDGKGGTATATVNVAIAGVNDLAVITGTTTGNVTEDATTNTATGTLSATDVDSPATFVAQANTNGTYGSFALGTDGAWTYTLDNSRSATNALAAGQTVTDVFSAATADGTAQAITITVAGSNDLAVITGTTTGNVTEDATTNTATGTLSATDVDSPTTFVAQANTNGTYGSFALGTNGAWTYTLGNSRSATNALAAGQTVTDVFTSATADGTTKAVTITLTGNNDAPVAVNDNVTTTDLQPVTFNVLTNDSDVDTGDLLSILSFTNPTSGTVAKNADNTFTYTPTVGFIGNTSFNYTIKDLAGLTSTATVTLNVTAGSNSILGTSGNDNLLGTSRDDVLRGLDGNDTLNGAAGADTLIGGTGNDTYVVDNVGDRIIENPDEGVDLVQSSITYSLASLPNVENLTLIGTAAINGTGNSSDNAITGNSAANVLDGGLGNDTLNGGAGNDTLIGGTGDDVYVVDAGDTVIENAGEGTDLVQSSVTFSIAAIQNVENLTLTGTAAINGTGNALDNVITGNSADNILNGADGNDTLNGGAGNDTLNGGAGGDRMVGGAGNDIYFVNVADFDTVVEALNEGIDTVISSVTYALSSNVENLTLTGTAALEGNGNNLDNVITGNAGNNILTGGAGNDTLIGGAGSDNLSGGGGNDVFVYTSFADRNDIISDFNINQDKLDLRGLNLGANAITSGFLRFNQSGSSTLVQVDLDGIGTASTFSTLVTLNGVNSNNLVLGTNVLVV
ncbi:beta strand repeat-containing protein [Aerosakkonemataceae cyanobacterium BLCC-F50]|uniref:Beta strand repeat-containing protein n=1 Tax=Floridaenema flaviceps BLCC-F50 TaxID=3153642 RepID=A0ABV4XKZ8_9CYAN